MTMLKTYSPTNMAKIVCPIFGAEVELRGCLTLRDRIWAGKPEPVRQGCQACMRASKCPIVPMIAHIRRTGQDIYHAVEAKTISLGAELLGKIAAIIVPDSVLNQFNIPARQRELIVETNGTTGAKKLRTGGIALEEITPQEAPVRHSPASPKKHDAPDLDEAARTGNITAAINAAMTNHAA